VQALFFQHELEFLSQMKISNWPMSRVRGSLNATISGKTDQVSCASGA